jgi:O-antigen/teichoic acid export membrane protein
MNIQSIKSRFLASLLSNGIRAALTFLSGLLVARYLGPSEYGNLTFIFGSFLAIFALIDAGSSSAFYTYISQEEKNQYLIVSYVYWILIQFILVSIFIIIVWELSFNNYVWPLQNKVNVILGFVAIFLQQKIWQMISQIGEAKRNTVIIQILNIFMSLIYLISIYIAVNRNVMSISTLFIILILINSIFSIATIIISYKFLNIKISISLIDLKHIYKRYKEYCKPLVFFSIIVFANDFSEKWMLQYFGGSTQQGFYSISSQFSAVTLLATTSILTIFWKEISYARKQGNVKKIQELYKKVNRGIVIFGAIVCGALFPWVSEIIDIFLGVDYKDANLILIAMLIYPIHQAMGQVGGTMLLADGKTKQYMYIGLISLTLSMPMGYFILAPKGFGIIGGLGLGAEGMALKLVIINIFSVNLLAWYISKINRWNYDWKFQIIAIPGILFIGWFIKYIIDILFTFENNNIFQQLEKYIIFFIIYLIFILLLMRLFPTVVGLKDNYNE